jgi:hypothetical protein
MQVATTHRSSRRRAASPCLRLARAPAAAAAPAPPQAAAPAPALRPSPPARGSSSRGSPACGASRRRSRQTCGPGMLTCSSGPSAPARARSGAARALALLSPGDPVSCSAAACVAPAVGLGWRRCSRVAARPPCGIALLCTTRRPGLGRGPGSLPLRDPFPPAPRRPPPPAPCTRPSQPRLHPRSGGGPLPHSAVAHVPAAADIRRPRGCGRSRTWACSRVAGPRPRQSSLVHRAELAKTSERPARCGWRPKH